MAESSENAMVHPATGETEEQMLSRHKKELRQLEGKIRALMKQAKQQSKKAEAEAAAAEMELALKRRHADELAGFFVAASATATTTDTADADGGAEAATVAAPAAAAMQEELAELEQTLEKAKKKSEKKKAREARKKEIEEAIRATSAPGARALVQVPEEFNEFFGEVYGERWPQLLEAMQKDDRQCARLNQHLGQEYVQSVASALLETVPRATVISGPGFPFSVVPAEVEHDKVFPHPRSATKDGLLPYYIMDLASTVVPMGLPLRHGFQLLDMCAAPGGKTLVLCERLAKFSDWQLVANERSNDRRNRLMQTVRDYVPYELRGNVSFRGQDATAWRADEFGTYDAVLLDAPCSGERHLLHSAQHMADWTARRTKRNGELQRNLLFTALKLLRPGGVVVYSTCSISPVENDEVVQRTLKRNSQRGVEILRREDLDQLNRYIEACMPHIEATECGYIILPDRCDGWGPMFLSILRKSDADSDDDDY